MDTILFLILAYIGGKIGIKLKLPAGALLGSMLLVGAVSILDLFPLQDISPVITTGSKVALGIMIGLMFTRDILKLPISHIFSLILLGISGIISAIAIAVIFKWMDFLPFLSGVIAVAPGGITEMLTLATTVEADTQAVVMMHLIRFLLLMLILRWFLNMFDKKKREKESV